MGIVSILEATDLNTCYSGALIVFFYIWSMHCLNNYIELQRTNITEPEKKLFREENKTLLFLGGTIASFIALMILNAFILTTLDTATRITRLLTEELFHIKNKLFATSIVILVAGYFALLEKWQLLWPLFGSANQLLAALALLAGSVWLAKRSRDNGFLKYPMIFMFAVTLSALLILIYKKVNLIFVYFSGTVDTADFSIINTSILAIIGLLLFAIAIVLAIQAGRSLKITKA